MKTKTFKQIIERLMATGVESIKIMRSDSNCGCIKTNDIIAIEFIHDDLVYIISVSHVFDNPLIDVDRIIRDEDGRCIRRFTIWQYKYTK